MQAAGGAATATALIRIEHFSQADWFFQVDSKKRDSR